MKNEMKGMHDQNTIEPKSEPKSLLFEPSEREKAINRV